MIERMITNNFSSHQRPTTTEGIKVESNKPIVKVNIVGKEEEQPLPTNKEIMKDKVEEIVKGMNEFLTPTHTSLKFEFHEKLNEYYVTLIDDKTKEVVREIPPKKLLDFYASMTEAIGLLVDKKI